MKVLVTGASGFVGQALLKRLELAGHGVSAITRSEIGDIDGNAVWQPHLADIDAIVHLAARVHIMQDTANDSLSLYRTVNTEGTIRLAEAAREMKVRRFVFVSSIKVNGERSDGHLTAQDPAIPQDPYAISKWEAERALAKMSSDLDVVTLRPPLVYGPHVKGNFRRLIEIVDKGIPLPLASVHNRRSFINLANLTDAISWGLTGPTGLYLPSDKDDKSTADLIRSIARALGKPQRLFPFPPTMLTFAGKVLRKSDAIDRLIGTLTVDGALPGWTPPQSFETGINQTIDWYRTL
ncbi:MAG: NAD-dependent epimerase/dehydratase family protein [Alphaproteobacteria bacterium]|jgi:nucleoside-diphosphate-sugar epimerase|nr:NAD-dependent epimerase/dehydratase family protein [Alphaproteobacteria bacterium]